MSNELKIKESELPPVFEFPVYQWCSKLTAEQDFNLEKYYWTKDARRLLNRLKYGQNQLIAVIGLQGSGKTALNYALLTVLDDAVSVKWLGKRQFLKQIESLTELGAIRGEWESILLETLKDKMGRGRLLHWIERNFGSSMAFVAERILNGEESAGRMDPEFFKAVQNKLSKADVEEVVLEILSLKKTVLIDLPDYSKDRKNQMIRDLREIESLWHKINMEGLNFVLFVQKELFQGHFFYGKYDVYEISPLSAEDFFRCYLKALGEEVIDEAGNPIPFTSEAFCGLAILSRGILRRFKKYVRVCLESWYEQLVSEGLWDFPLPLITKKQVVKWIHLQMLERDMELELMDLYPHSKINRRYSVILLRCLQNHGKVDQKTLTIEVFGDYSDRSKMACSRLLANLEAHGYVQVVKRGAHGLKFWSLAGDEK